MNMNVNAIDVTSPDDISAELLTSVLQAHYNEVGSGVDRGIEVTSMEWKPLGRGALSNVRIMFNMHK